MSRQSLFVPRAGWVFIAAALLLGVCFANAAGAEPAAPTEAVKGAATEDSQRPGVLAPAVDDAIRQRMQDRAYGEAIQAIDAAIARGGQAIDCLSYLKGRALALQGEYAKAAEVFSSISETFPQSPWQRRARFEKAAAAVGQGDYRAAQRIYRGEAEYLFGTGRKQQIAAIYLEFAAAAFQPRDKLAEPDYRKALEFYSAALGAGLEPGQRPEVELQAARCCQELGDLAAAIERFTRFADDHPGHALLVEARFRLGECQLSSGKRAEARRTWEDLLAECGKSDSPRIAEAAFRLAETWGVPEPANAAELDLGVAALESFLARFPEHPLASKAPLLIAKSDFHQRRFADAADRLQGFLGDERLARASELPEALELLGRSYQAQSRFDDALAVWRRFLVEHPADERWSGVQQAVIDTEYLKGIEQRRRGQLAEARKSLAEFLAHYPLDHRCPEILFLFGEMLHTEKKFDEAIAAWGRLVSKHPGTPEADRGQLRIAETLEQDLGKFEEAIDAYRKAEQGSKAADARQAIARLSEKHVALATECVFRTNQPARLRLTTRNIESVTIRAYRIDMETYFRKMYGSPDIEQLDIGLIDPDKTSELSIAGYRAHQQFDTIVEAPFEGDQAGGLAITASSGNLESTTLAIRSDLDVIVKSSRTEVFVFAENMRTGKPWPSARLLISNGREMLAEAETGPDGVFRTGLKQLAQAEAVCAVALAGEHAASNAIGLASLGIAKGLDNVGYVCTDRPAYRAGDAVQVSGWIRRVAAGEYAVDEGKQCTLELYDARRRLVRQKKLTLGRFGTFHDAFTLPAACPEGQCRLVVHDHRGRSYDGTLRVHAYKPALVRLVIDCPRSVYCRGEQIEGTIRAETCYGAPLAGRQIRYMLGDDLPRTARTDERGVVRFSLPTRQFHENQRVALKAELPQRNLQASVDIQLATQGYTIELSTARPVFLAGELFEIRAETFTPEGKPVGEKLALKVFERTKAAGIEGQRLVRTIDVATDQANGVGRTSLALEAGGRYVLRAEGTDQFDHPVSAQTEIEISADEDPTRLRILANRLTWQVGETANVIVHWRGRPALGLITFQAARILGYRLVELRSGQNPLSIPMTAQLAPNFELAVAVMTDEADQKGVPRANGRFHQASAPLTVERDLDIDLAWTRAGGAEGPIRPGERLELTLKTTDPLGKPVSAEVCLAMLEQSVVERFPLAGVHAADLFRGISRATEMRTGSSITFSYHPERATVNPQILAEQQRIETRRAEETSRQSALAEPGVAGAPGAGLGGYGGMGSHGSGVGGGSVGQPAVVGPPQQVPADPFAADPVMADPFAADPFAPRATPDLPPAEPWSAPAPMSGENGYWNPAVITDESGRATVTLEAPTRETTWEVLATGITADTLVGETSRSLVAKKELSAELRLPLGFVEGDKADIPVSVHQARPGGGPIEVVLKTTILGRSVEDTKTIQAAKGGNAELVFHREFLRPEPADAAGSAGFDPDVRIEFELTAVAGGDRVTVRRVVPLLPFGAAVHAIRSGLATADAAALVEPPEATPISSPSLQILVSPTVERCLLDSVLARPPGCQIETSRIASDVEIAAADLMASLALRGLLTKTKAADGPAMRELDSRLRAAIGLLVLSQLDDGGWGWAWHSDRSQLFATSYAVWALSLAKAAGYPLPASALPKALKYLREQLAAAGTSDNAKAVILHAMTLAGEGDFNLANRLQRIRTELSTRSLLYLALAFAAMDRAGPAGELLDVAAQRDLQPDGAPLAELEALRALAAEQVRPGSAKVAVDWLLAHRTGHRWSPERATGPAVQALCGWFAGQPFDAGPYRLDIFVNGTAVKTLEIEASSETRMVDVPASLLVSGPQQVRFAITGKGRFAYECILGGFVPADQLQSTTAAWQVERTYEPAPLEVDGREIAPGFSIVAGAHKSFRNSVEQLPAGRRAVVRVTLRRPVAGPPAADPLEYLVVKEPIPSGAEVIEPSVTGSFESFQVVPGGILFHLGSPQSLGTIEYQLYGAMPGEYRAAPTVVSNAYRPEQRAVASARQLAVLAAGEQSKDPYRLTPDELLALGSLAFGKGDFQSASKHLGTLVSDWNLPPDVYQRVILMLLDAHLELGPPDKIVRYFELLIERWPDEEISFEKALKIGAAYEAIGEFERSYIAYRAAVEGSFLRESSTAGFLQAQGEFLRSVDFMERLLQEYPAEPYAAAAACSLAQQVHAKALQAAELEDLRKRKVNRVDLTRRAAHMLDDFLTVFPEDPAADRAAFSRANALLELQAYGEAVAECNRYAQRYPKSDLLDSFWYMIGYCQFAAGEHDAALAVCRKVSETSRVDPATGQRIEARNKWLAVYMLGQIYHSLGQAEDAIREYRRVEDKYDDARAAVEELLRKRIGLPELTVAAGGAPVELDLEFRNLASCDLKVYRIDLMKFALLRRELGGTSQINLAGVRPRHEAHVELGDGRDYRDRTHKLSLPLAEEGAYLVVCRGENLHASGVVLVSPLSLEVHEDLKTGQVRATVRDMVAGRCASGAHVKVIGGSPAEIVSGETDLRGVFVAEAVRGPATVIALVEPSRYAMHRGPAGSLPAGSIPSGPCRRDLATLPAAPSAAATAAGPNEQEERIKAALQSPAAIDVTEAPLATVAAHLSRQHGINIQLDRRALDDVGLSTDTPITKSLSGLSLKSCLRLILRELNLTYVVRDEVLLITTPEEAEREQVTRLYPVSDLVLARDEAGQTWADFDSLIQTVTSTVEPESWDEVGGPGSVSGMSYPGADVLVIRQTDQVHEEIASLLARMRSMAAPRDGKTDLPVRPRGPAHPGFGGMGGMGGGLGAGGGGMGGMAGGEAGGRGVTGAGATAPAGRKTNLLEDLQKANQELQGQQVEQLEKMYERGSGMGGMGGGFF
jgi:uncharacterized protein YfaS (alpha-2-macroglobulin family)/TolA-binding protein